VIHIHRSILAILYVTGSIGIIYCGPRALTENSFADLESLQKAGILFIVVYGCLGSTIGIAMLLDSKWCQRIEIYAHSAALFAFPYGTPVGIYGNWFDLKYRT